jgi:hypothetical protein
MGARRQNQLSNNPDIMSGTWAIAIADYDNEASNTLKLTAGGKIFDCRVDVNAPEWSFGTGEGLGG